MDNNIKKFEKKILYESINKNKFYFEPAPYKRFLQILSDENQKESIEFSYLNDKSQQNWAKEIYYVLLDIIPEEYLSDKFDEKEKLLNYFCADFRGDRLPEVKVRIENGNILYIYTDIILNNKDIRIKKYELDEDWIFEIDNKNDIYYKDIKKIFKHILYNPDPKKENINSNDKYSKKDIDIDNLKIKNSKIDNNINISESEENSILKTLKNEDIEKLIFKLFKNTSIIINIDTIIKLSISLNKSINFINNIIYKILKENIK